MKLNTVTAEGKMKDFYCTTIDRASLNGHDL